MPIFRNCFPEIDASEAHEGRRQEARVAKGLRAERIRNKEREEGR